MRKPAIVRDRQAEKIAGCYQTKFVQPARGVSMFKMVVIFVTVIITLEIAIMLLRQYPV